MSRQFLVSTRKRSSQRPNAPNGRVRPSWKSLLPPPQLAQSVFVSCWGAPITKSKCTKQKSQCANKTRWMRMQQQNEKENTPPKENQVTLLLEGIFWFFVFSWAEQTHREPPDGMAPMQQTTQMVVAPLNGNGAKSGARTFSCCSYVHASALL